jgi:hypothetical protein
MTEQLNIDERYILSGLLYKKYGLIKYNSTTYETFNRIVTRSYYNVKVDDLSSLLQTHYDNISRYLNKDDLDKIKKKYSEILDIIVGALSKLSGGDYLGKEMLVTLILYTRIAIVFSRIDGKCKQALDDFVEKIGKIETIKKLLNNQVKITVDDIMNPSSRELFLRDMMVLPLRKYDIKSESDIPYLRVNEEDKLTGISSDTTFHGSESLISQGMILKWHRILLESSDIGAIFVRYLISASNIVKNDSNKTKKFYNGRIYAMDDQLIKDTSASVGNNHTTVVAKSDDDSAWNQVSSWGDDTEDIASILNDDVHERE